MPRTPDEQAAWEFHRWQGFTRFRESTDGKLIARIDPSVDILAGLAGYFARRLRGKAWTLIDVSRQTAAVCQANGKWKLVPWNDTDPAPDVGDKVETLWKAYFETIEIRERRNPALQKQHVPLRYRAFLPEFNSPEEGKSDVNT